MIAVLWRPLAGGKWQRVRLEEVDRESADGFYPRTHLGLKESEVRHTLVPVKIIPVEDHDALRPDFSRPEVMERIESAWGQFTPAEAE